VEKTIMLELGKAAGSIVSRELLGQVLNGVELRTVDAHIVRLRSKIEANPKSPEYLQTIRGEGYVLWGK
jgi:two-component system phosphate regulon response regulator OmpR